MSKISEEDRQYMLSLIKQALVVDSDESEGQLTIDLNIINLCSADYTDETGHLNDIFSDDYGKIKDSGTGLGTEVFTSEPVGTPYANDADNRANMTLSEIDALVNSEDIKAILVSAPENLSETVANMDSDCKAIIEFAGDYIKDTAIQYKLNVVPGQELNEDTIIGEVEQYGGMKPIRSIFSQGKVVGNEDNTDFFRLYPSECNRHIVIDNFQTGTQQGIDTSYLEQVVNDFKLEGYLYQLIVDNICYSTLPEILTHRQKHHYLWESYKNGVEIFNDYKSVLDDINNNFADTLLKQCSEDNIRATNANVSKLNALGDEILGTRQDRYDKIIELYNTRKELEECEYDRKFKDCKLLAVGSVSDDSKNEDENWTVGDTDYHNYYMNLLSRIHTADEDDIYSKEYFDLLSNIISMRMEFEKHDIKEVQNEFEDLYYRELDPNRKYRNVLTKMQKEITDPTYSNIQDWLTNHTSNTKDLTAYIIQQLVSIYQFILNYNNNKENIEKLMVEFKKSMITDIGPAKRFKECESNLELFKDQMANNFKACQKGLFYNRYYWYWDNDYESREYENLLNSNTGNIISRMRSVLGSKDLSFTRIYDALEDNKYENGDIAVIQDLAEDYVFLIRYEANNYDLELTITELAEKYLDDSSTQIYSLVENEAKLLEEYWEKTLAAYQEKTFDKVKLEFNEVAFSLSKYAEWPIESIFRVNGTTYYHYLFEKKYNKVDNTPDDFVIGDYTDVTEPEIPDSWPAPDASLRNDFPDKPEDVHAEEITYLDFKYWLRYFALATVICLIPTYWNCGLDILPFILMIPLPCIFIAINSVYILLFDIVIVFGIAIRGMYPSPIVLYVNASDLTASVLTPLIGIIKNLKKVLDLKIEKLEYLPIQSLANTFITKLEKENRGLLQEIENYEVYANKLKTMKVLNQEECKSFFKKINTKKKLLKKAETTNT